MTTQILSPPTFELIDHDASFARLRGVMTRLGATMSPEDFITAVSNAYHAVAASEYGTLVHHLFRTSGSYEDFKQSLVAAKKCLVAKPKVLDLGCGSGYDLEVLREVLPPQEVGSLFCCDISADMMAYAEAKAKGYPAYQFVVGGSSAARAHGPFDLIITHSLVHHIPSLSGFFDDIDALTAPGGVYVMGHEPNRRHWTNAGCQAAVAELEAEKIRTKKRAKYLDPLRYWNALLRKLGFSESRGLEARVNELLHKQYGLKADLSEREIQKLVDIHVPFLGGGDFSIGYEGFEVDDLQSRFLKQFERVAFHSSSFLGHFNPGDQSPAWRRRNTALARNYPSEGANFSAVWRKLPA